MKNNINAKPGRETPLFLGLQACVRSSGRRSRSRMSTMKFCRECNNILYPKEDKINRKLLYACRNCDHCEPTNDFCVYRNEVHHTANEKTQVLQDVAFDPTVQRTKAVRCPRCQHGEAVYFQAAAGGEEGLTLLFICCNPNCGHRWKEAKG